MKVYVLDYDAGAAPEDGSEGDINGSTRFVKLDDAEARIADQQALITQLEDEVAMLIHPHDLAAYRKKKTLHK